MDLATQYNNQYQRLVDNLNSRCEQAGAAYTSTVDAAYAKWEARMVEISSITDNVIRAALAQAATAEYSKAKSDAQKAYDEAIMAAQAAFNAAYTALKAAFADAQATKDVAAAGKKSSAAGALAGAFRALTNTLSPPVYNYSTNAIGIRG